MLSITETHFYMLAWYNIRVPFIILSLSLSLRSTSYINILYNFSWTYFKVYWLVILILKAWLTTSNDSLLSHKTYSRYCSRSCDCHMSYKIHLINLFDFHHVTLLLSSCDCHVTPLSIRWYILVLLGECYMMIG